MSDLFDPLISVPRSHKRPDLEHQLAKLDSLVTEALAGYPTAEQLFPTDPWSEDEARADAWLWRFMNRDLEDAYRYVGMTMYLELMSADEGRRHQLCNCDGVTTPYCGALAYSPECEAYCTAYHLMSTERGAVTVEPGGSFIRVPAEDEVYYSYDAIECYYNERRDASELRAILGDEKVEKG